MKKPKRLMKIGILVGCCLLLTAILNPCMAKEGSPWMVRAHVLGVIPDDSSSQITVIGGEADVEEAYTPDLDLSYFFTDNIAAELVFFAYSRHDVKAKNTAEGEID
jgi:outer membrane protein